MTRLSVLFLKYPHISLDIVSPIIIPSPILNGRLFILFSSMSILEHDKGVAGLTGSPKTMFFLGLALSLIHI